ncbi:MAG: hypothetical protein EPN62_13090 [Candidimonas sp.]|nr:MAG: hypothetical protein EPN77_11265 [Candidimonas sp.]TAM21899.1 MAG: hypothetical protein EPN62_13090 [Candidimonas sp.]
MMAQLGEHKDRYSHPDSDFDLMAALGQHKPLLAKAFEQASLAAASVRWPAHLGRCPGSRPVGLCDSLAAVAAAGGWLLQSLGSCQWPHGYSS